MTSENSFIQKMLGPLNQGVDANEISINYGINDIILTCSVPPLSLSLVIKNLSHILFA